MLSLPQSTEIRKQLPKTAIYQVFGLNSAAKDRFDEDVSRMYIVNEISPQSVSIAAGGDVNQFFVVQVLLKQAEYDERSIAAIAKLIPQNVLFVLEYEGEAQLAVWRTKLIKSGWKPTDQHSVTLRGLDLAAAWENIIADIGGISVEEGNTLNEQIVLDEQRAKIEKEIARLEKLARAEKQPKRKFELVQKIKELKMQNS